MTSRDQKLFTKLFVTNIPGDISKEYFVQLIQPYAQNGRIIEIKFFKRVVSESCYAFIHFESAGDGEKCMEDLNRRILNGHTMRVGPASKRNPLLSTTNLYIEGVPKEWTDSDLRKHFGEFGEIAAARILVDKGSNASREVGFVHFTNHENALSAMETWQDNKAYKTAERPFKIKFANKGRKKDGEEEIDMNSSRCKSIKKLHNIPLEPISSSYHHPVGPSQYPQSEMNTPRFDEPCRYFQRGNCKRGKNCFYRHGNVSVNPSTSNITSSHHHQQGLIPSHHHHIPPPPPPPPPPPATYGSTYDPYAAAAAASMYPHSATTDMSAYYQHYYGAYGTTPHSAAPVTGDMTAYYQQAYAAYPHYPPYAAAYPPQPTAAIPATLIPQQQQQQQPPQSTATSAAAMVATTIDNNNNNNNIKTEQQQQAVNSTVNTTTGNEERKTNHTENGGDIEQKTNTAPNPSNDRVIATDNNNNNNITTQQPAAWYASSVAAPNMNTASTPTTNMNAGYGASRQPSTAATDARWDPYKVQGTAYSGYYPPAPPQ